MTTSLSQYTGLVTSEHADKPNFLATLAAILQPFVDLQNTVAELPTDFDIDFAVGAQLDAVGVRVGRSRFLNEPITGVYFSWGTAGVGWGQGTWKGEFDPSSGLVALPDDSYRVLLKAKIANNQWDGTIPSAYDFMDQVFPGDTFFIQDNQNMTMYVGVVGPVPLNAVTFALLSGGYLQIKPAGVGVVGYITASVPGTPVFGFGADNSTIGGWGHGSWAVVTPGA